MTEITEEDMLISIDRSLQNIQLVFDTHASLITLLANNLEAVAERIKKLEDKVCSLTGETNP